MVNHLECSRCLLSTDVLDVKLGSDGVCSVKHSKCMREAGCRSYVLWDEQKSFNEALPTFFPQDRFLLFFLSDNPSFIDNVLDGEPLKEEASILLEPVGLFSSPPSIRLPDYVDWNCCDDF